MTVKSTRKNTKAKSPTAAQARKQLAEERARADKLQATVAAQAQNMEKMFEELRSMKESLTDLKVKDEANERFKNHNPSAQVINDVLGRPIDENKLPIKPDVELPPHVAKLAVELERHRMAKNNPVNAPGKDVLNSEDEHIGQMQDRVMLSDGPAGSSLSPLLEVDHDIVLDNKRYSAKNIEELAFMYEYVLVRVDNSTTDESAPLPETIVNGSSQFWIRGEAQWVRRYHVERLARAKRMDYTQEKYRDTENVQHYKEVPIVRLEYPFSIVRDDNPKGRAWIEGLLAEAF